MARASLLCNAKRSSVCSLCASKSFTILPFDCVCCEHRVKGVGAKKWVGKEPFSIRSGSKSLLLRIIQMRHLWILSPNVWTDTDKKNDVRLEKTFGTVYTKCCLRLEYIPYPPPSPALSLS